MVLLLFVVYFTCCSPHGVCRYCIMALHGGVECRRVATKLGIPMRVAMPGRPVYPPLSSPAFTTVATIKCLSH